MHMADFPDEQARTVVVEAMEQVYDNEERRRAGQPQDPLSFADDGYDLWLVDYSCPVSRPHPAFYDENVDVFSDDDEIADGDLHLWMPLHTDEEGASDLTAVIDLTRGANQGWFIEKFDIHVP